MGGPTRLLGPMPNRGAAIDPFELREVSRRINTSVSMPVGYLIALQKHREQTQVPTSAFITAAIKAHAETVGLELPEIKQ